MQAFLTLRPDAGSVMKGTGGMRKLRWAGSGRGKRGGLRVIYYWWVKTERISLLMVYPKNEQDDLTADQLKQLKNIGVMDRTNGSGWLGWLAWRGRRW